MTNPLTPEELEHLAEVREVYQTVNTAGWRRIRQQMQKFVDEALETMAAAGYGSPEVKASLQMRWQQRIAMLRGVDSYIDALETERKLLLEESQKPSVPRTEEYAERDSEVAGWTN